MYYATMTIDDIKQLLFSHEMKDQIRSVVREEIENEVGKIEDKLAFKLKHIDAELATLSDQIKNIEILLKNMQKDITKIQEDINMVIRNLNLDDIKIIKRVEKIEAKLGITPMI